MSECELLYGQALSDRVRLVCAEDEVDCAVAFLSTSVRDDLFPRWRKQTVRIVCDISMGCNSRSTLKAYGAPKNSNLRTSRRAIWRQVHSSHPTRRALVRLDDCLMNFGSLL